MFISIFFKVVWRKVKISKKLQTYETLFSFIQQNISILYSQRKWNEQKKCFDIISIRQEDLRLFVDKRFTVHISFVFFMIPFS